MTITQVGTPVSGIGEPITVTDVEKQVRFDLSDQTDFVNICITALREKAEAITRRSLIIKQQTLTLDAFPVGINAIEIPNPPLRSVDKITYLDFDLQSVILDPTLYRVVLDTNNPPQPSKVVPAYGKVWPVALNDIAVIGIDYTSGYGTIGDDTIDCPKSILQWLLLNAANLYEHRETLVVGKRGETLLDMTETLADSLIANYRVWGW